MSRALNNCSIWTGWANSFEALNPLPGCGCPPVKAAPLLSKMDDEYSKEIWEFVKELMGKQVQ